jgi:hypothetical protein
MAFCLIFLFLYVLNLLRCPVFPVQLKGRAFVLLPGSSAPVFTGTYYFRLPSTFQSPESPDLVLMLMLCHQP